MIFIPIIKKINELSLKIINQLWKQKDQYNTDVFSAYTRDYIGTREQFVGIIEAIHEINPSLITYSFSSDDCEFFFNFLEANQKNDFFKIFLFLSLPSTILPKNLLKQFLKNVEKKCIQNTYVEDDEDDEFYAPQEVKRLKQVGLIYRKIGETDIIVLLLKRLDFLEKKRSFLMFRLNYSTKKNVNIGRFFNRLYWMKNFNPI